MTTLLRTSEDARAKQRQRPSPRRFDAGELVLVTRPKRKLARAKAQRNPLRFNLIIIIERDYPVFIYLFSSLLFSSLVFFSLLIRLHSLPCCSIVLVARHDRGPRRDGGDANGIRVDETDTKSHRARIIYKPGTSHPVIHLRHDHVCATTIRHQCCHVLLNENLHDGTAR